MDRPLESSPADGALASSTGGDWSTRNLALLLLLTLLTLLIMGYHPGLEDDAFYLAAIKKDLNHALFPYDSDFFQLQFQATIFDKLIAFSARVSRLPLAWTALLWQLASVFFVLHGCWRISRRCFAHSEAQWAAVTLIATLLTLPLPGIAINLADQYLHPRTLATAAILAAIIAILDQRIWLAGILLALAFSIHAIMASFGISFCAFLWWSSHQPRAKPRSAVAVAISFPLGWIFEPASDAWRKAAATRDFYFLGRWHWYEWLGVFAPLVILFALISFFRSRTNPSSASIPLLSALFSYGLFQTIVGLISMIPAPLERLRPFEPMRYLHLLYLLFFLIAGGLLGRHLLRKNTYRWALFFVPFSAGMLYAQRQMFPASPHLELPFVAPRDAWLQAFDWIRRNTPINARFAIDPHYETMPGEEFHGFRALAERSVLADYEKDGGMAARVPRLAPRWLREVKALEGWRNFQAADFHRLKNDFGVSWVVLSRADKLGPGSTLEPPGMSCPYENQELRVCMLSLK